MENPHVSCFAPLLQKLSTLWQPRQKTAVAHQFCVDHYYACVDITWAYLSSVCYDTYECVKVRAGYWRAGTPHVSFLLPLLCLLLLLPYHVVRITPCLKLPSSLLCGGDGTTATAQQDFYACVDIMYKYVRM